MFSIRLKLENFHLSDFAALDYRRAMGLEDMNCIRAAPILDYDVFDVTEAFARTWFNGRFDGSAEVNHTWLVPGELGPHPRYTENGNRDIVRMTLTPERARDLFVRAKFAKKEEEIAELEAAQNEETEEE